MTESVFAVRPIGEPLPMGALPYGVDSDHDQLLLVMAGAARFGDATFEQSIRQVSAGGTLATAYVLDLDHFTADAAALPTAEVAAVYHVGRCGSTLLARMLAVDPSLCVFSEPAAWATLQQLGSSRSSEHPHAATAADGCLRLFGRFASDRGQRLVLKPSSWQVLHAPAIRAAGHATKEVFLFRSPAPVVASNLNVSPGFVTRIEEDLRSAPTVVEGWLPGVDRSRLADPVDLLAELWRLCVDAALGSLPDLLLLSYDELMTDPEAALARVARHLDLPSFPMARALAQRDFYSKSASRSERFDPAGAHQRRELTGEEQDRVEAITRDAEARLLAAWETQRHG